MTVKAYLEKYNIPFQEVYDNHFQLFSEIFEKEKTKNWLVPIDKKLGKLNNIEEQNDIRYVIDKLKSDQDFTEEDTVALSIFISKINRVIKIADRINNFKEGTSLEGGTTLELYDLFNFVKSIKRCGDFEYVLNKNLDVFKPHLFSIIKHCQNPLMFPIYYPFWQKVNTHILKLDIDYDAMSDFYRTFPVEDRILIFGSYYGTIATLTINGLKDNKEINREKIINFLKKEVITIKEYAPLLNSLNNKTNNMRSYWLYSPGEQARLWEEFYKDGIMALGWDEIEELDAYESREDIAEALRAAYGGEGSKKNDTSANDDFGNKMQIGDIVIVKKGIKTLLGYGEIISEYFLDIEAKEYKHRRKMNWHKKGSWTMPDSMVVKTLTDITNYQSKITPQYTYAERLINIMDDKLVVVGKEQSEIINLLNYKKQIILQGPPGTGKTREAKIIAREMLGLSNINELEKNEQFKLVQFHPSYTYEDFVRGIVAKPNDEGDGVLYEAENKILIDFAKKALENYESHHEDISHLSKRYLIEKHFAAFVENIENKIDDSGNPINLTEKIGIESVDKDAFRYAGLILRRTRGRMLFKDIIQTYLDGNVSRQDLKKNKNLSGLANWHSSYYVRVLDLFKQYIKENKLSLKFSTDQRPELKNYVLVIDEINRANLSSVLGELIYALEYRNEAVDSMYKVDNSNKLTLPPNLYIIGTMNTADRSVGHIDYAIRRRFAFVEVLPTALDDNDEIYFNADGFELVSKLFNGLNVSKEFDIKDVQIGHSYFIAKKSEATSEQERDHLFGMKMQYEVVPILEEYVRDGILINDYEGQKIKDYISSLKA